MDQRQVLEMQADRIEATLQRYGAPGRVSGGTVTPRWVRFQVMPAAGARISRIKGLSEELAAALAAPNCRVSRRGAVVAIDVPREDPRPVSLVSLYRQLLDEDGDLPRMTALLGLGDDGAPLLIRLPSPDVAHVLVAGTTGSGKTVLLRGMILSLALRHSADELAMVLVDPRGGGALGCLAALPNLVRPVVFDVEVAAEALDSLTRLMEQRDRASVNSPPVVVFIDELADLLLMSGARVQRALTRLTQRGRGTGIHIVAATQKPTAAVLGSLFKANFPVRLVGKVTSIEDARVAAGICGSGAERLLGRGDFLAVAEGRVMRFQAAFVSPEEICQTVAWLTRRAAPVPRRGEAGGRATPEPGSDDERQVAPARAEAVQSSAVTLPDAPDPDPEPDEVEALAARLRDWWRENGGKWGAKSQAVRFLFGEDAPAAGHFWDTTMEAIALLETEDAVSTPTPTSTPSEQAVAGISHRFGPFL